MDGITISLILSGVVLVRVEFALPLFLVFFGVLSSEMVRLARQLCLKCCPHTLCHYLHFLLDLFDKHGCFATASSLWR